MACTHFLHFFFFWGFSKSYFLWFCRDLKEAIGDGIHDVLRTSESTVFWRVARWMSRAVQLPCRVTAQLHRMGSRGLGGGGAEAEGERQNNLWRRRQSCAPAAALWPARAPASAVPLRRTCARVPAACSDAFTTRAAAFFLCSPSQRASSDDGKISHLIFRRQLQSD